MPTITYVAQYGGPRVINISSRTTFIDLSRDMQCEIDLSNVVRAPRCKTLCLGSEYLATVDLAPLRGHSELESISLSCGGRPDLSPLAGCPALRELQLRYRGPDPVDLSALAACVSLTSLEISFRGPPVDLSPLSRLGLTSLAIASGVALDLRPLGSISTLREFSLSGDAPTLDLAPLEGLSLERATISMPKLARVDLSPIATQHLRTLTLCPIFMTSLDLGPLRACRSLTALNLSPGDVSILRTTGIAALEGLTTVRFPKYVDLFCDVAGPDHVLCGPLRRELASFKHAV